MYNPRRTESILVIETRYLYLLILRWCTVPWSPSSRNTRTGLSCMGLLPDTQNRGLRMRRGCRERFSRHRLQKKPLISDLSMHHGTCVTHVPWCMSGSLNSGGGENVPGISGACATRNFSYLSRGPWTKPRLIISWLRKELGHHHSRLFRFVGVTKRLCWKCVSP